MYKKRKKKLSENIPEINCYVLLILLSNTYKLTVNLTVNYWLSINTENSELPF